jgi:hypothetical protein
MTISSMMNIALSGMRTEQNRLATVAGNIAHSGPGASTGAAGETDAEMPGRGNRKITGRLGIKRDSAKEEKS